MKTKVKKSGFSMRKPGMLGALDKITASSSGDDKQTPVPAVQLASEKLLSTVPTAISVVAQTTPKAVKKVKVTYSIDAKVAADFEDFAWSRKMKNKNGKSAFVEKLLRETMAAYATAKPILKKVVG